jgi:predicted CxxxxCH...CXXCH cytochrome family protein
MSVLRVIPGLALLLVLATAACDDEGGDGDGDVDGDLDSDIDGDGDADGDGDIDGDGDSDEDQERDLTRCGEGGESCSSCHGGEESAAPPPDTEGRTDPSELTVGTHEVHRIGGSFGSGVPCSECHQEPSDVFDVGHCDSPAPAEVTFGDLASRRGTFPVWDRDEGTCSQVYCHGATLTGGSNTTPSWTGPGVACGDCHIQTYHGQVGCDCHSSVWSGGAIISPELHINGQVNM